MAKHSMNLSLTSLAHMLEGQISHINNELSEVDSVTFDAIEKLTDSFGQLAGQFQIQKQVLVAMDDKNSIAPTEQAATSTEVLKKVTECADKQLKQAVIALQFQDLVSQRLGHIQQRLTEFQRVLKELGEFDAQDDDDHEAARRLARLIGGIREFGEAGSTAPVNQALMKAGDVDLF